MAHFLTKKRVVEVKPIVGGCSDTLLYVVSFDSGWMILPADKRAHIVLAESSNGLFSSVENNPGVAVWLNQAAGTILSRRNDRKGAQVLLPEEQKNVDLWRSVYLATRPEESKPINVRAIPNGPDSGKEERSASYLCLKLISTSIDDRVVRQIGPLLKTNWGQMYPWNTNLPFVWDSSKGSYVYPPAGCTAVAIAQVLYFTHDLFNVPSGLYHNVVYSGYKQDDHSFSVNCSRSNYVVNSPRWEQMPLERLSVSPSVETPNASYVADLLADVGYRVGMDYGPMGSGASISLEALNSFGLTYDTKDYDESVVISELSKSMPVLIVAFQNKVSSGWWFWKKENFVDGHTWVIDGLRENASVQTNKYLWVIDDNRTAIDDRNDDSVDEEIPQVLLDKYVDVVPLNKALSQGLYPNKTEEYSVTRTSYSIFMNWGWDGRSNAWYSPSIYESWNGGGYSFKYNKVIYYNIRKL